MATYYLGMYGSNSNHGMARSQPWATIPYAFGNMSEGDTLVIGEGEFYTGHGFYRVPRGITIKVEREEEEIANTKTSDVQEGRLAKGTGGGEGEVQGGTAGDAPTTTDPLC